METQVNNASSATPSAGPQHIKNPAPAKSVQPSSGSDKSGIKGTDPKGTLPDVSIRELAADVAKEKALSIKQLESVTESIQDAVALLNEALSRKSTSALIRHDKQLNRFFVTITDRESGEIVREIPSEALLKFARNLEELRGLLFDKSM